jgi:hypothetical protein
MPSENVAILAICRTSSYCTLRKLERVAARSGPHSDHPIAHFTQAVSGIKQHSYKFLGVCVGVGGLGTRQLQMLFTPL